MVLVNGDVFYPVGVYCIPVPEQRTVADLLSEVEAAGRGFMFQEFAANGGNFVLMPCFHYYTVEQYEKKGGDPWWDNHGPRDITDMRFEVREPNDWTEDLQPAAGSGVLLLDGGLTYNWSPNSYYLQPYIKFMDIFKSPLIPHLERSDAERELIFADVKAAIESTQAEEGFFGWRGAHEPVHDYDVTFKPYFSGAWPDTAVEVVNEEVAPGVPRTLPVVNGAFTDVFRGEDVHIYKFTKPSRFGE